MQVMSKNGRVSDKEKAISLANQRHWAEESKKKDNQLKAALQERNELAQKQRNARGDMVEFAQMLIKTRTPGGQVTPEDTQNLVNLFDSPAGQSFMKTPTSNALMVASANAIVPDQKKKPEANKWRDEVKRQMALSLSQHSAVSKSKPWRQKRPNKDVSADVDVDVDVDVDNDHDDVDATY